MKILIYGQNLKSSEDFVYLDLLVQLLIESNVAFVFYEPLLREVIKTNNTYTIYNSINTYDEIINQKIDIAITMGGDGTILQSITLLKDCNVPILGINLGRLGFLASVEKSIIAHAIEQLLAHKYRVVSRSVLKLSCNKPIFGDAPIALNDFTLNKRDTSSMITIHIYIDDNLLNSYWADGIIISTPTGSTGYSLSCGGPIVFPDSKNFIITPVAPHNLNLRPVVIPDSHILSIRVEGRTDSFMCTLDSRYETVTSEHHIEISKGDFDVNFIELEDQSFIKTINAKLMWGLDQRN